jgi:hypothetical protein
MLALGQVQDFAAFPALVKGLSDEKPVVRQEAAFQDNPNRPNTTVEASLRPKTPVDCNSSLPSRARRISTGATPP